MMPRLTCILALIGAILFADTALYGAVPTGTFIRAEGEYPLDDQGSKISIKHEGKGQFSFQAIWKKPGSSSGADPENAIKSAGWFVYIENPNRIWIYSGSQAGLLINHAEKRCEISALYPENMRSCPKDFWQALPDSMKRKYPRAKAN